jgi:hypothetical protein
VYCRGVEETNFSPSSFVRNAVRTLHSQFINNFLHATTVSFMNARGKHREKIHTSQAGRPFDRSNRLPTVWKTANQRCHHRAFRVTKKTQKKNTLQTDRRRLESPRFLSLSLSLILPSKQITILVYLLCTGKYSIIIIIISFCFHQTKAKLHYFISLPSFV